jgi:hypothetical protein
MPNFQDHFDPQIYVAMENSVGEGAELALFLPWCILMRRARSTTADTGNAAVY